MTPDNTRELIAEARTDIADAERCEMLGVTPSTGTLLRALRKTVAALAALTTPQEPDDHRVPRLFVPEWGSEHCAQLADRNARALEAAKASTGELATRIEVILSGLPVGGDD